MPPVLLDLSFVKEGIKIGCNIILGMWRVAERIKLYWTHCRTYKDRGWMDSLCLHSTWNWRTLWHYCNFNYFSVTFRIAGLPTWRATDCDLVSCNNWRVGAKWHVSFRGWRGSDAIPLLPRPLLPSSDQFLRDPLDDYWRLNVQTVIQNSQIFSSLYNVLRNRLLCVCQEH